jgi:hypothetical protein
MAVTMKCKQYLLGCDVVVKVNRRFGGKHYLQLQDLRGNRTSKQRLPGFLHGLLLDPTVSGCMFL